MEKLVLNTLDVESVIFGLKSMYKNEFGDLFVDVHSDKLTIYTSFSKKVILDDLSNLNIDDIIKQLQEPMDCNFEQNIEVKSVSEFNIENIFEIEELNPNDIDDLLSCQTPNDSETETNVSNGIVDVPKITKIEKPKASSKSKNVINARNYRRRQKESQKILDQKCIDAQKLNEKLKLKVRLQSELLDKINLWIEHS